LGLGESENVVEENGCSPHEIPDEEAFDEGVRLGCLGLELGLGQMVDVRVSKTRSVYHVAGAGVVDSEHRTHEGEHGAFLLVLFVVVGFELTHGGGELGGDRHTR